MRRNDSQEAPPRPRAPLARSGSPAPLRGAALAVAAALLAAPAAVARPGATATFTLDPAKSHVTFTLQATLHTVGGSFRVVEGAIAFDPEGGDASGRIVVDVASGDTDNPRRDRDMHHVVLESDKYPQAVFTATHVDGALPADGATRQLALAGELTLHGTAHKVEIPTQVTRHGALLSAEGDLEIPYVDWGLEDPSKFVLRVAKEVTLHLTAVGELTSEP